MHDAINKKNSSWAVYFCALFWNLTVAVFMSENILLNLLLKTLNQPIRFQG